MTSYPSAQASRRYAFVLIGVLLGTLIGTALF